MKKIVPVIFSCLLIAFCGCSHREQDAREAVTEWIGKTLVIPENIQPEVQGDPVDYDFSDCDYVIINYINSSGCTSCKLKFSDWNAVMNELSAIDPSSNVGLLIIANTRERGKIKQIARRDSFYHPVIIDKSGLFEANNISKSKSNMINTWLVDNNFHICAVGNPVNNPHVKELYKKFISGGNDSVAIQWNAPKQLSIAPSTHDIGIVTNGNIRQCSFILSNLSDSILTITHIIPSCECVSTTIDRHIIQPHQQAIATVTYTADTISGAFTRYVEIFVQNHTLPAKLTIKGIVAK